MSALHGTRTSSLRPHLRRVFAALSATGLATIFAVTGPVAASALSVTTCTGTQSVTFSPGIVLLQERNVQTTVSGEYECVSADVDGATTLATFTGPERCLNVDLETLSSTFTWNDGSTSTATYETTVTYAGGTTVLTKLGEVTAGRFTGDSFLQVITGPTISGLLACLTPTGLTQTTETALLTITSAD